MYTCLYHSSFLGPLFWYLNNRGACIKKKLSKLKLGNLLIFFWLFLRSSVSTEDLIVILRFLFKVFRFQRKTLLLFFGFFFFIKVFRFQRKTLLLFFGFFLRFSVSTEDLIVILRFLFFIYYYYYFFLTRFLQNAWTDFHEIFRIGV